MSGVGRSTVVDEEPSDDEDDDEDDDVVRGAVVDDDATVTAVDEPVVVVVVRLVPVLADADEDELDVVLEPDEAVSPELLTGTSTKHPPSSVPRRSAAKTARPGLPPTARTAPARR